MMIATRRASTIKVQTLTRKCTVMMTMREKAGVENSSSSCPVWAVPLELVQFGDFHIFAIRMEEACFLYLTFYFFASSVFHFFFWNWILVSLRTRARLAVGNWLLGLLASVFRRWYQASTWSRTTTCLSRTLPTTYSCHFVWFYPGSSVIPSGLV